MQYRSFRLLALLVILFLPCASSAECRQKDEHWPYKSEPETAFQKVLGPAAADATFIINGRPVGFSACTMDLKNLQSQIGQTLRDAEENATTNGEPVVVADEPLCYLKNVKYAIANLSNPAIHMFVGPGGVQVTYSPPAEKLGEEDIRLYDALASICARQHDYSAAYHNMMKSLERKRAAFGPSSDRVIEQLVDIACLHEDTHNYNAAEKYFRQALDITKATHSDNSREHSAIMMQLSNMLNSAGKHIDANNARAEAVKTVSHIHDVAERPIPEGIMGGHHSWTPITQEVTQIASVVNQSASRRKADVEAMRQTLYNLIHEQELAKQRAEDAKRRAGEDERKRKIREENEKLLGAFPNLVGITFINRISGLGGYLKFVSSDEVDIAPDYEKLDAKTVAKKVGGTYQIRNDGTPKSQDWIVRVKSQFDGTDRIDEWHIRPGDEIIGEVFLDGIETQKPYPAFLKGTLKIDLPEHSE